MSTETDNSPGTTSESGSRAEWRPKAGSSRQYQLGGTSAVVAGATGGLGRAIAAEMHARGADLTLIGRSEDKLSALPVSGVRLALDLRKPDACNAAVEAALQAQGRLDVVVNATGVVAFGPLQELSLDTLEELVLTNLMLPVMLAKAALSNISRGGVIVNISGVIAEQNLPGMAAYGASKAALRSFDEGFAREARRAGVRVLDARPPHTNTELASHPIEGTPPKLPQGLDPSTVARVIIDAIADGTEDLPSTEFSDVGDAEPTGAQADAHVGVAS